MLHVYLPENKTAPPPQYASDTCCLHTCIPCQQKVNRSDENTIIFPLPQMAQLMIYDVGFYGIVSLRTYFSIG